MIDLSTGKVFLINASEGKREKKAIQGRKYYPPEHQGRKLTAKTALLI